MTATATAAIAIRGLEKRYPSFTLGPIDLTVPRGAIYGLVGPNGAGKTTTIDLIFGMGAKRAGTITVLGLDHLRDEVAVKQQMAYVSPDLGLGSLGTVGKAIQFVRSFHPSWDDQYCARLMDTFGLAWSDRILALSFGNQMKLTVLLALAWRPKVLVLDEPTIGLDAIAKQQVFAELLAAVRDEDRTVLISSHGLTDLERFTDHIGIVKAGRMLIEGPTSDVTERFRMIDLETTDDPASLSGVVVQTREGRRARVLLDRTRSSLAALTARGAIVLSEVPVTLEELFVALARD